MRSSLRRTALAVAAVGFGLAGPAVAGLSLSIKVNQSTTDLSSNLTLNAGTGDYTFGGASGLAQYAVFNRSNGHFLNSFVDSTVGLAADRIAIQVKITDNQPGTSTLAKLFSVTNAVRSSGGGDSFQNVGITVVDDRFTQPTGALTLTSQFSGSGGSNTGFSSYVQDGSTTLAQILNQAPGASAQLDFNISSGTTYALMNVTSLKIGASSTVSTGGYTQVSGSDIAAVPEPATLVLALTAVVPLGLVYSRRSRAAKAAA